MKSVLISVLVLAALTAPLRAEEAAPAAPPAPKPADITRSFTPQDVAVIAALCDLAMWANRIAAEPPCKALAAKLARTTADDAAAVSPAKP